MVVSLGWEDDVDIYFGGSGLCTRAYCVWTPSRLGRAMKAILFLCSLEGMSCEQVML